MYIVKDDLGNLLVLRILVVCSMEVSTDVLMNLCNIRFQDKCNSWVPVSSDKFKLFQKY